MGTVIGDEGGAAVRAAQVVSLDGPAGVQVVDVPEPVASAEQVLVDVHCAGISFPDLLLAEGKYQLKPELPFTIGIDYAGSVRCAPLESGFKVGDRVAGFGPIGAAAEVVAAPPTNVLALPQRISFEQGACLPLNYLTALFALTVRGDLRSGETVLVHGAAGGVGTATIQIAHALGAQVIAVVSSEHKHAAAIEAGADHVVASDGFRDAVQALTGGAGVNIVVDVVGSEELVLDSLRSLASTGRLLVVGFTGGQIAAVKLNRLLLNNIDVRGVSWGPYVRAHPGFVQEQWAQLTAMIESGAIEPTVGSVYALDDVGQALQDIADRRTTGKSVLRLR
jgi:NADPH:quinone reductase